MKKLLLIALLSLQLFADGLIPFAGLSMHTKSLEHVDTKADSPLGNFGVRYENIIELEYKHISSIPNVGIETRCLNLLSAHLKASYKFVDIYGGYGWHSEKFDGSYYSEQFTETVYKYGLRINYGDKRLFVEHIKSTDKDKSDLVMYGFEILFNPEDLI